MFFYLLLLFTLMPLIELTLLIKVGQSIGAANTLALVILTGLLGAWLARREGLRTYIKLQNELRAGQLPGNRLIDALLILVAGALLVTPGIITDVIGFSLLIPPARAAIRAFLKKRFSSRIHLHHFDMSGFNRQPNDDFIDVEARPMDENPDTKDENPERKTHLE
jgi:UPF0716 protein FxsA